VTRFRTGAAARVSDGLTINLVGSSVSISCQISRMRRRPKRTADPRVRKTPAQRKPKRTSLCNSCDSKRPGFAGAGPCTILLRHRSARIGQRQTCELGGGLVRAWTAKLNPDRAKADLEPSAPELRGYLGTVAAAARQRLGVPGSYGLTELAITHTAGTRSARRTRGGCHAEWVTGSDG
jgi:hypothetical protein